MEQHEEIIVVGHVIVDTIRMEVHVHHVEIDNIVVHDQVVVLMQVVDIIQFLVNVVRQHVVINQQIHTIQVMEQHEEIIVVGHVIVDTLIVMVHVLKMQAVDLQMENLIMTSQRVDYVVYDR